MTPLKAVQNTRYLPRTETRMIMYRIPNGNRIRTSVAWTDFQVFQALRNKIRDYDKTSAASLTL